MFERCGLFRITEILVFFLSQEEEGLPTGSLFVVDRLGIWQASPALKGIISGQAGKRWMTTLSIVMVVVVVVVISALSVALTIFCSALILPNLPSKSIPV
jgi:hypothetical protein